MAAAVAGAAGGLALAAAGYGMGQGRAWGRPLALTLTVALGVFFAARYARTRAVMPGGLMAILSLLALAGVLLTRGR